MEPALVLIGALSVYSVGDGYSGKELACGGTFTASQRHIAIRGWKRHCGARVRICSRATKLCAWTKVADSGPWGAVSPTGVWKCWPRPLLKGWKRRAVVDIARPLWIELGRPRFLSQVRIEVYPRGPLDSV